MTRQDIYRNRCIRYRRLLEKTGKLYNRISWVRGGFLLAGIGLYLLFRPSQPFVAWGGVLLAGVFFALAVMVHGNLSVFQKRGKTLLAINEEALKRLRGEWKSFLDRGEEFLGSDKPHLADLHIFGKDSLFQMIQLTSTAKGREQLARLLSGEVDFSSLEKRQQALKELAPLLTFRHRLFMEGRFIGRKLDMERFLQWARGSCYLEERKALLVYRKISVPATFLLMIFDGLSGIGPFWIITLFLQFSLFALRGSRWRKAYEGALEKESHFTAYGEMFRLLEKRVFKSPHLRELQEGLEKEGQPLSFQMKRLEKINGSLCVCFSSLLYPILNTFLLWDIHFLDRLERWKRENAPTLEKAVLMLAEMESLLSLAGFCYDNPHYNYPLIKEGVSPLEVKELGHPLIAAEERIDNDFSFSSEGFLALVTGSNMSGKSTFIRTVGINMVLAQTGSVVAAQYFQALPCRIVTSIQIADSLQEHTSHFYGEVKRVKSILEAVEEGMGGALPCLYLIDEIFTGTNTRERLIASREILLRLADSNSYGFLTTHDLDLVHLEKESGRVINYHFQDHLDDDGEMFFDYKIRSGPIESTNALHILRKEGIEVREKEVTFPDGSSIIKER